MTKPYEVVFVCWGNICRSPMAERIAEQAADRAGLTPVLDRTPVLDHTPARDDGVVRFSSAGVSDEEQGNPIDPRAEEVLAAHGCRIGDHRAHQITAAEVANADLVVCMTDTHLRLVQRLAPTASHLTLLTDFDPQAEPGSGVPDPWYGSALGFEDTWAALVAAMPGLLDRITQRRPHD